MENHGYIYQNRVFDFFDNCDYTSEPGIWFLEIVIINPKNHLDIQWGFGVVFSNRPTVNYTLNLLKKEGWFARIVTPHTICLDRSPKCFPLAYGKWVHLATFQVCLPNIVVGSRASNPYRIELWSGLIHQTGIILDL
jgi:hypothetical protein